MLLADFGPVCNVIKHSKKSFQEENRKTEIAKLYAYQNTFPNTVIVFNMLDYKTQ